jgi:hypothetical protein
MNEMRPLDKAMNSIIVVMFAFLILAITATLLFMHYYLPQVSIALPSLPNQDSSSLCDHTGVQKHADGSFSFSPLTINPEGDIIDANNTGCNIYLLGVNQGGLFLGHAGNPSSQAIAWEKSALHINVVREAYNAYWYNTPEFRN